MAKFVEKNRVSFTLIDKCLEFCFFSLFLIPLFHLHLHLFIFCFNFFLFLFSLLMNSLWNELTIAYGQTGFSSLWLCCVVFVSVRWSFSFSKRSFFHWIRDGCGVRSVYAFSLSFNLFFRFCLFASVHRNSISISFAHLSRVDDSMLFLLPLFLINFSLLCLSLQFNSLDRTQTLFGTRCDVVDIRWCSLFLCSRFPWLFRQFNECFLINVNALKFIAKTTTDSTICSVGYRKMMMWLSEYSINLIKIKEDLHPLLLLLCFQQIAKCIVLYRFDEDVPVFTMSLNFNFECIQYHFENL